MWPSRFTGASLFSRSLLLTVAWGVAAGSPSRLPAEDPTGMGHALALSRAFRGAAETALPSVVTVVSKIKPRTPLGGSDLRQLLRDPRLRQLFPDGLPSVPEGEEGTEESPFPFPELNQNVGSGVIIDPSGIVLTNAHVVREAEEVVVRLRDGREFIAKEAPKADPLSDIAVLKITSSQPLPAATLGDSDSLEIGDWVIAIGSPFELEATVSAGIISGKGRGIDQIRRGKLLQTDAAINPGNSGGPLVNLEGAVVGINTAIATSSGGYQGIGFAIPISRAKWVVRELRERGTVRRAYLGIRIADTSMDAASKLGVPARSGVVVVEVVADGPAAEAGVRRNDVITSIANQRVFDTRDLQDAVEQKEIGSRQPLKLIRDGEEVNLEVVMKALPDDPGPRARPEPREDE